MTTEQKHTTTAEVWAAWGIAMTTTDTINAAIARLSVGMDEAGVRRLLKGAALAEAGAVERVTAGDGTTAYLVTSSGGTTAYAVTDSGCSCADAQYRAVVCCHQHALRLAREAGLL